jgi:NAD-dependent deacetylase
VSEYKSIVVLTGAGISAESGLATFRGDGLWANYRIDDVATPEGYARNPDLVNNFYNKRRQELKNVEPNAAHVALAEFELGYDGEFLLVTQNVDDLHDRAGSKNLIHMHGELLKVCCTKCGSVSFAKPSDLIDRTSVCENCESVGTLRPDIVWFGEIPKRMDEITRALGKCDLFVSIGTSGVVYPAAGFVQMAKSAGAHTVELNLDKSEVASLFDEQVCGKATVVVGEWLRGKFI